MSDKRNIGWILYFTALCLVLGTLLSCNPSDIIPFEPEPDNPVPETPVPDGPGEPSQPVDPSQPVEPSEPEGPTDPEEPESPTDPEDPEQPTDPEEPEQPQQPAEGKSIVFVDGVTATSGWYDVNKMGDGTLNGDINMCWAAASANMIQWWQDRYVAAGKTLPSTAVNGPGNVYVAAAGRKYELAIMDMYHSQWNNDKGCHTTESIPWYFEGVNYGQTATAGSQAYPLTAGGYWSSVWSGVYPYLYHEYSYMFGWYTNLYTAEYTAYEHWGDGSSLYGTQRHKKFSDLVVLFISRGITSMTVTLNKNGGLNHATTVWGYEIDNSTGLLTRLWITDSDDLISEPKQQLLNEYSVSYNTGDNFITLSSSSVRYGKCYVISLNPFSGYGSGN
ncbi:MAG: IdeS/Mac family cysteine endopeptidase [Bacteroidales bacterium]|nr:IdeS/Mac family cysteine endopeptidase [Bacteroidales bacterium]